MIVIDRETLNQSAESLARTIKNALPPGVIFFLWLSAETSSTYMSNGTREDMVKALRELANHLENRKST